MKVFLSILSVFILFSCNVIKQVQERNAQRKIEKIKGKYPTLFEADTIYYVKNDTLIIETTRYEHDTIIQNSDTVIIETDRFKTRIIRDTLNQLQVNTTIKSDTIELTIVDTITTIREAITIKTAYKDKIPIWLIVLCVGLTVLFIVTYIRYLNFTK